MARLIEATAENGVVTVQGFALTGAEIVGAGIAKSEGYVIIDDFSVVYFASNALDIKAVIESLVSIIEKVTLVLTGVDAASNSPGGQTANIAQVTALKTQFNLLKDQLR